MKLLDKISIIHLFALDIVLLTLVAVGSFIIINNYLTFNIITVNLYDILIIGSCALIGLIMSIFHYVQLKRLIKNNN